ncbi:MAG: DUF423 domain-containing protein [Candidatus Binatia bacterium]
MDRLFFIIGSVSAFIAVVLGAFGAHSLKDRLSPEMLNTFEVGVRYHMYHALALIAVAWASVRWPSGSVIAAGWLFLTGLRWLGAITPIGGAAFLLGWLLLAWGVWR